MTLSSSDNARDGIISTALTLDGEEQFGQGNFVILFDSSALTNTLRVATYAHTRRLNIAVAIHPAQAQVVVLMNVASGSASKRRQVYILPDILDGREECQLVVHFQDWRVRDVVLEQVSLAQLDETIE